MIQFSFFKILNAADGRMELNVNGQISKGQFTTIYGSSGAGKTSILRMLAGLFVPDEGYIEVNGTVWLDTTKKINLPPQHRNIGYVFQNYALFPNMTIFENLQYALPKNGDKKRIDELLEMADLTALKNRKPATLSGGQQQRVALTRALVRQPDILLLDEPLSALDEAMRIRLQDYILTLHQQFGLTTLLVSHDLAEIYKMSDQIYMLEKGQFLKQGTPNEIFTQGQANAKYQTIGTVVEIKNNGVAYSIHVLVGHQIITLNATQQEGQHLNKGDKVIVMSAVFEPKIQVIR